MSSQDSNSQTAQHSQDRSDPQSTEQPDTQALTESVSNALPGLAEDFLHSDPPEMFAGDMSDDEEVTACLTAAAEYFHSQLSDEKQSWITNKWGLTPETISQKKIGFIGRSSQVITHLKDEGFSPTTIIRASLGTEGTINHLYKCNGVSPSNDHLVSEEHHDTEVDHTCPHHPNVRIEMLVRAMNQDAISLADIDLESVVEHLDSEGELNIWSWWDNRLTIPYRNEDSGEIQYFIARATDDTDDQIYNNGVVDRSESPCLPLSETPLTKKYQGRAEWTSNADDYLVLPHSPEPYKSPQEYESQVDAVTSIVGDTNSQHSNEELLTEYSLEYAPSWRHELDEEGTTRIHVFAEETMADNYDTEYIITPPAIGVSPGMSVTVVNHTTHDIETNIAVTPEDVWWEDTVSADGTSRQCTKAGMYKFNITVDGENHRVLVNATETVNTDRRNTEIEHWVDEEPTFTVDLAKYVKQTVDRPWVNNNSVSEPIFGAETIHEDCPLIVTEGIADAIAAHQYNLACVSPATTNFKTEQYEQICDIASDVSAIHIINDNEASGAGIEGALRSARIIEEAGHPVQVCELPRPDGQRKIDVAEFLKTQMEDPEADPRNALIEVVKQGMPPQQHPKYTESHDPHHTMEASTTADGETTHTMSYSSNTSFDPNENYDRSALYDLSIGHVVNHRSNYRGVHPLGHYGNSEGYFTIRGTGEEMVVKDYKATNGAFYRYNALTWLATAAGCDCEAGAACGCTRSVRNPSGGLSLSEVWWAWHHAKTAEHIDMPDEDKVPSKAMWFLASHHDLLPEQYIPDTFDEDKELPPATYNTVVETIETEYGLNAGREPLDE